MISRLGDHHFDWSRLEAELTDVYVDALRAAPLPQPAEPSLFEPLLRLLAGNDRDGRLAGLDLHGARFLPTGRIELPALRATIDRDVGGVRLSEPIDLSVDVRRSGALARALTAEATRADVAHWWATAEQLVEALHRLSAGLEAEARRRFLVSSRFSVVYLGPPPRAQRHSAAPSPRDPFYQPPRLSSAPPPALRARWRRIRRALGHSGAHSAELGIELSGELDPPTAALVLRVLLGERSLDDAAIDGLLEAIDRGMNALLDAILHDDDLQRLEAAWRAIEYLVLHVETTENIAVAMLDASKELVAQDLALAPALDRSGLFRQLYTRAYRPARGRAEPFGVVVALYDFGPEEDEIQLLEDIASVAHLAQSIVLAGTATRMFGYVLGGPGTIDAALPWPPPTLFDEPHYARWQRFRAVEASRYVGLCAIRFRTRLPYDRRVAGPVALRFREAVDGVRVGPPWASSAVLLAQRIGDAFAKYRLSLEIVGTTGGAIPDLPGRPERPERTWRAREPWTEADMSSALLFCLFEQGFIGWMEKDDSPCFLEARSCHRPRISDAAEAGERALIERGLEADLRFQLLATRFVQYLKVVRLERFGALSDPAELEAALEGWLGEHAADNGAPIGEERPAKPLREAHVTLAAADGDWIAMSVALRPHFRWMGGPFTLTVHGYIERDPARNDPAEPLV